ncbi:MAG: M1 family metallopeptidase, partial [Microcoleus sp. SIO2G3]|nr:M1 family metallopeptidase [Microcoleus sp. SIO2G3]
RQNSFRRVAEQVSGQNLKGFLDRWFYSNTLPPLPTPKPSTDRLVGESGVNLSNLSDRRLKVTLTEKSDRNVGGFYRTDNPYGVVVDPLTGNRIAPGEQGYAQAALRQSVKPLDRDGESLRLQGGAYYVPYLLEDGRPRSFVSPFTSDRQVELSSGGTYRFSDRSNLGSSEFNDLVLQVAPIR